MLFKIREALGSLGAFHGKSLGMLPSLKGVMIRHARRISSAAEKAGSFYLIPYPF